MTNILKNLEIARSFYDKNHEVISRNISNANIPKMKSQKIDFDFSKLINYNKLNRSITQKNHIDISDNIYNIKPSLIKNEKNINGNNINLRQEEENITENAENIKIVNDLYKQIWKIVKIALGN